MNWEARALRFINHTSHRNTDIRHFLSSAISYLRELTGAFIAFQIRLEDAYTARVTDANPEYLEDIILSPAPVEDFIRSNNHNIVYWKDIAAENNIFEEVLMAVPSAMFIPVKVGKATSLIVLAWTDTQSFDISFQEFADVVQVRLTEIVDQANNFSSLQADRDRFYTILQAMPQAVVFIDNDNYVGWTNTRGATLLRVTKDGEQELNIISVAMNGLRETLTNKEEVNQRAAEIFSKPEGIVNWRWEVTEPHIKSYHVSCSPIVSAATKGMLWVFNEIPG